MGKYFSAVLALFIALFVPAFASADYLRIERVEKGTFKLLGYSTVQIQNGPNVFNVMYLNHDNLNYTIQIRCIGKGVSQVNRQVVGVANYNTAIQFRDNVAPALVPVVIDRVVSVFANKTVTETWTHTGADNGAPVPAGDMDGDGQLDNTDPDKDGDGVNNDQDDAPEDPNISNVPQVPSIPNTGNQCLDDFLAEFMQKLGLSFDKIKIGKGNFSKVLTLKKIGSIEISTDPAKLPAGVASLFEILRGAISVCCYLWLLGACWHVLLPKSA